MNILEKHLNFVNEQIAFQSRMMEKYKTEQNRAYMHEMTRGRFQNLLDDIVSICHPELRDNSYKIVNEVTKADIKGIPHDVIEEIKLFNDKPEGVIYEIINKEGETSLDKLILDYYRKTHTKMGRQTMISKIHKLNKNHIIERVGGKRGWYKVAA